MFRILIVEDMPDTLEQLEKLLLETFPDSKVDTAQTVKEATSHIESAFTRLRPYHAVILDWMLPKNAGEEAEPDESLYELLGQMEPQPIIALTTAHFKDEKGQAYLQKADGQESGPPKPPTFAQMKIGAEWGDELIQKLKAQLYGRTIKRRLRALFSRGADGLGNNYDRSRRSRTGKGVSLTHEISSLIREIEAHWRDLDLATQEEIREVFFVEDGENDVRAGLL